MEKIVAVLVLATGLSSVMIMADVQPDALFSHHMILQRGGPASVWGIADAGEQVVVTFRDQTVTTQTTHKGKWAVSIDPGPAGGPFSMTIKGNNIVYIEDIYVGEVWVCSGQSNMQWRLGSNVTNNGTAIAQASFPMLRHFQVENATANQPQENLKGKWTVCSPETAPQMTAVGFFFGRELMKSLNIPIGLIHTSWGGTPAQAWSSYEVVSQFPEYAEIPDSKISGTPQKQDAYAEKLLAWLTKNDSGSTATTHWSHPGLELNDWQQLYVPGYWEKQGILNFNGIAWYRKSFELPPKWQDKDLVLELGPVDDSDTTWINGEKIGFTNSFSSVRSYPIPAAAIRPGTNVIAIRVMDYAGNGGIAAQNNPARFPFLRMATDPEAVIQLAGKWDFRLSTALAELSPMPPAPPRPQQEPTALYNAMIAPLLPYSIRGVIWYQGESNANDPEGYLKLFPAMVEDWRVRWNRGDFPFLYVQVAPYVGLPPEIREAQLLSLKKIPNSAMVVTLDIGNPEDIHPANKTPVGERLALAARALAYGENIVYSGPLYASFTTSENEAIIHFDSVGPGLVCGGDYLSGFTVAGSDGIFHPATARIEENSVVVSSLMVPKPAAVRYAWANVAEGNLYNKAGLPASPFRTDIP